MPSKGIEVEISAGEFVDKLTILRIKKQRISDPEKAANVLREHDLLQHRFEVGSRTDPWSHDGQSRLPVDDSLAEPERIQVGILQHKSQLYCPPGHIPHTRTRLP